MLRAPLEQLALRIKVLNLGLVATFLSKAIEPPSATAIQHVVEVLRYVHVMVTVTVYVHTVCRFGPCCFGPGGHATDT